MARSPLRLLHRHTFTLKRFASSPLKEGTSGYS
jgi:hypothetical protein